MTEILKAAAWTRRLATLGALGALALGGSPAQATLVAVTDCGADALSCTITGSPPSTVTANPNDGVLLLWNEKQNVTLTEDLAVDRVFDESADFVSFYSGNWHLEAGTIVSSHYVQWDPATGTGRVTGTISADSQIFAFIFEDQKLFQTDALLGLDGVDYNDFALRGLEPGDVTDFDGESVEIDWTAGSPGDWTRLITAYSPAAAAVPVPAAGGLLALGLAALAWLRRRV